MTHRPRELLPPQLEDQTQNGVALTGRISWFHVSCYMCYIISDVFLLYKQRLILDYLEKGIEAHELKLYDLGRYSGHKSCFFFSRCICMKAEIVLIIQNGLRMHPKYIMHCSKEYIDFYEYVLIPKIILSGSYTQIHRQKQLRHQTCKIGLIGSFRY